MGHIGLLPQTAVNFKVKGKNLNQKRRILDDAKAISKSGVATKTCPTFAAFARFKT